MGHSILSAEVYIKEDHSNKTQPLSTLSRLLVIWPLLPSAGARILFPNLLSPIPLLPYLSSSCPELPSVLQVCCALPRLLIISSLTVAVSSRTLSLYTLISVRYPLK